MVSIKTYITLERVNQPLGWRALGDVDKSGFRCLADGCIALCNLSPTHCFETNACSLVYTTASKCTSQNYDRLPYSAPARPQPRTRKAGCSAWVRFRKTGIEAKFEEFDGITTMTDRLNECLMLPVQAACIFLLKAASDSSVSDRKYVPRIVDLGQSSTERIEQLSQADF